MFVTGSRWRKNAQCLFVMSYVDEVCMFNECVILQNKISVIFKLIKLKCCEDIKKTDEVKNKSLFQIIKLLQVWPDPGVDIRGKQHIFYNNLGRIQTSPATNNTAP